MSKTRVNWTIGPQAVREAQNLSDRLDRSISQVVEDAIREYYQKMTGRRPMSTQTLGVEFLEIQLSESGQFLIETARRQSNLYSIVLSPGSDGLISATLWDNDSLGLDDTISIIVRSKITRSERMRQHGVEGLAPENAERDENGKLTYRRGPQGDFIPSEKYIANVSRAYGDTDNGRRWTIPAEIIRDVRRGKISGVEAINRAGDALVEYLKNGQFEVDVTAG